MSRGLMNYNLAFFESSNKFSFPDLFPYTNKIDVSSIEWVDFPNSRRSSASGLHFYCDDYKFNSIWEDPRKYLSYFSRFKYVVQFDFSLYYNFPVALQIYNKYRNHWLSAYFSVKSDVDFIPNISVSTPDCWNWSFDGFPKGSVVAFSDIGAIRDKSSQKITSMCYEEMLRRLEPIQVLYFTRSSSDAPSECSVIRLPFLKG